MIKKYIRLYVSLFFVCLIIFKTSLRDIVYAGDYDLSGISQIELDDWNKLNDDFIKREGATMTGSLNFSNSSKILYVPSNISVDSNLSNIQTVNSVIEGSLGEEVYYIWGKQDCGTDDKLYSGYGFSGYFGFSAGSNNPICIEYESDNSVPLKFDYLHQDSMYPLTTGKVNDIPTSAQDPYSKISSKSFVQCAACLHTNGSCFESYGSWDCNFSMFTKKIYDGYLMGAPSDWGRATEERHCVNRDFNAIQSASVGAVWSGSIIENNFDLEYYTKKQFVKCAICCN
jgi:hypothetical protein